MLYSEIEEEFEKESYGALQDSAQEKDEEEESVLLEGGLEDPKPIQRKAIDYKFMDGLRGIGAFAVYLCHFFNWFLPMQSEKMRDEGKDVVETPLWTVLPPFQAFRNGQLWVGIFFILSGFVLPLNFFKTGRESCITGGVMRRYFRLMLPLLMIQSLYYLCGRLELLGTYNGIRDYSFAHLLWSSLLGVWYGKFSYVVVTWTLSIELWGTFVVYLVALTAHNQKGRYFFYTAVIGFLFTMEYIGYLNLSSFELTEIVQKMEYFLIGVVFADLETMVNRPLDRIRNLHWGYRVPIELVLVALFLIWGSDLSEAGTGHDGCQTEYDGRCQIYTWVSLDGFFPLKFMMNVATVAAVLLAFTSDVFGWILASWPIQFLAQISFTLYLFHCLLIAGPMNSANHYLVDDLKYPAEDAVLIIFIGFTPILLLCGWILELIVDRPAKEFAGEFDRQIRRNRPRPMPTKNAEGELVVPDKEVFYSFSEFSKRTWPIYAFIAWLLVVFITVEIFAATRTHRDESQFTETQHK